MGAAVRSPRAAALLGIPVHLAGDWVPHRDLPNASFDIGAGLFFIGLLALRCGPTSPATIGALAACAPDIEHRVLLPRPGGKKLFHDGRGWHRTGPFSTRSQLVVASFLVGRLLANRRLAVRFKAVREGRSGPAVQETGPPRRTGAVKRVSPDPLACGN